MSDEEEELREFCDGFDEGTTDRIVEAFGSLSELKAVYELDRYVTDETLTQAGVRACWKNLLFKRLGGAPEYRMTAYNAPATPRAAAAARKDDDRLAAGPRRNPASVSLGFVL